MTARAQRASASAARAASRWNQKHGNGGTAVVVTRDDGSLVATRTTSHAYVASGRAVIHVEAISGFYLLDRIRAAGTEEHS